MTKRPKHHSKTHYERDDDHALWHRVAETITPISKKNRVHAKANAGADEAAMLNMPKHKSHKPVAAKLNQPIATTPTQRVGAGPSKVAAPEPKGLGQTAARRIRSGRTPIDARLDLHGMRQSEAHAALTRFLYASQQKGRRWVLVITGKGTRRALAQDHAEFDHHEWRTEPGILRRSVPQWLQEPDLRPLIIGYQTAAPQHGGEGALYIHLRRLDRSHAY